MPRRAGCRPVTDLAGWLAAQLDADEQTARETAGSEAHQQWALEQSGDLNEGALVSQAVFALADIAALRVAQRMAAHQELAAAQARR